MDTMPLLLGISLDLIWVTGFMLASGITQWLAKLSSVRLHRYPAAMEYGAQFRRARPVGGACKRRSVVAVAVTGYQHFTPATTEYRPLICTRV